VIKSVRPARNHCSPFELRGDWDQARGADQTTVEQEQDKVGAMKHHKNVDDKINGTTSRYATEILKE